MLPRFPVRSRHPRHKTDSRQLDQAGLIHPRPQQLVQYLIIPVDGPENLRLQDPPRLGLVIIMLGLAVIAAIFLVSPSIPDHIPAFKT